MKATSLLARMLMIVKSSCQLTFSKWWEIFEVTAFRACLFNINIDVLEGVTVQGENETHDCRDPYLIVDDTSVVHEIICIIEVMRPTVSLRNCKLSEAFLRTIEIRLREMNVVE